MMKLMLMEVKNWILCLVQRSKSVSYTSYIELNRECLYDRDVCGIMCLPRNGWDIW